MAILKDPISGKKLSSVERIGIEIADYRRKAKLDSWNSFVEELQVPSDLYPAIMSNRPELVRAVRPRDLPAYQVEILYKLIAGLIETNAALRQHTERVAQLTDNLNAAMTQFTRAALSIQQLANFTVSDNTGDDDEE